MTIQNSARGLWILNNKVKNLKTREWKKKCKCIGVDKGDVGKDKKGDVASVDKGKRLLLSCRGRLLELIASSSLWRTKKRLSGRLSIFMIS